MIQFYEMMNDVERVNRELVIAISHNTRKR